MDKETAAKQALDAIKTCQQDHDMLGGEYKVLRTEKLDGNIQRERECLKCGQRVWTTEFTQKRIEHQIKKLMADKVEAEKRVEWWEDMAERTYKAEVALRNAQEDRNKMINRS